MINIGPWKRLVIDDDVMDDDVMDDDVMDDDVKGRQVPYIGKFLC